jgi:uncharacterized phage protein gp47/JayE
MNVIAKDRRGELIKSTTLNGVDFVEVAAPDQKTLQVHFLNAVDLKGKIVRVEITGGEVIPQVAVQPIQDADWLLPDAEGRPRLRVTVAAPGDFSQYTLKLFAKVPPGPLDPFFDHAQFSFKALCDSQLDCQTPPAPCPEVSADVPPIDYLAKDFLSFRNALSDFSALRYPEWVERSEADFVMMFLEMLAAAADDLSYTQDRIAAEAAIETASERRSLVRHARLVDYEPRPATAAQVRLQFQVESGPIPPGVLISASTPDGDTVYFETGTGLFDKTQYAARREWNGIAAYYFDDSQKCLRAGSTDMWVAGKDLEFSVGQELLIDTPGPTSADPPRRQIIILIRIQEEKDPVFPDPKGPPADVTHIFWGQNDALRDDHNLDTTVVKGNLVPATQGMRSTETFAIDQPPLSSPGLPLALVRTGPNSAAGKLVPQYLYTLSHPPLAWLAQPDASAPPLPEIDLQALPPMTQPEPWTWRSSLLQAERFEKGFTVDPVRYRPVARNSDNSISCDYDSDQGDTIRFGDGMFGEIPASGTVFQVTYRTGGGTTGNVAADSITRVQRPGILAVTNPFAAQGGSDREPAERIRRLAPQAFRASQFRAVLREDYQAAAELFPWVEKAGTVFRWTGSWLTVFTTVDPKGTEQIPVSGHIDVINLLNRYRLAGYESYVPSPKFAALDLVITACAQPDAFAGDVQAAILKALSTAKFPDGTSGFFNFDNFTFGDPLERSVLEAAIQRVPGVAGVLSVMYRRRGVTPALMSMLDQVQVGSDEIIRVDNDPSRPERGSLKIVVKGGK